MPACAANRSSKECHFMAELLLVSSVQVYAFLIWISYFLQVSNSLHYGSALLGLVTAKS